MQEKVYRLTTEELFGAIPGLRASDRVLLSGPVYTARDAAHRELMKILDEGGELPFPLGNAVLYYAGPTPAKNGFPVGACGPTTSSRMDAFTPRLMSLGLRAMIGKGERGAQVAEAIRRYRGVYLAAVGGAGALISKHIKSSEEVAFAWLGCESVKRFTVEDLPLFVALDCTGGSIFKQGRLRFETDARGA